jgi:predicted transcriptional regulator
MQDHRIEDSNPSEEEQDFAVLDLLLHETGSGLWSTDELAAELGSTLNAKDALARLAAAGLVHRLDRFAFPSRSAVRFEQLAN